ncbi:MAG: hypothetical protein CMN30_20600 [Sandaracinus sp.]|nr:hypothetical protein [Sandaracinus sp.]|tara:strand:- start:3462 stop:4577 length:1116 start_codon:yes stop_codon:yes gene_type:complete
MRVIDRYELVGELGAGAYGRVYRARHQVLEREVALKVLEATDEKERFLREAAVLARLRHPNIVEVYDSGTTDDGHAFLALELLEGETLAQRLKSSGAVPVAEAVWILDQVLAALEAAHAQGIVHRDLKHPNVFLSRQDEGVVVKVLDFGIAKVAGAGRLTLSGTLVGTPRYMAPEVAHGEDADARSDIWAAGLMLYELLLAEPAYRGTPNEAFVAIRKGPPPSLRTRAPHLPPLVLDVVDAALRYEPAERFANAAAFREALRLANEVRPVRTTTQMRFATGSLDAFDLSLSPRITDEFSDATATSVDAGPHWSQRPAPPPADASVTLPTHRRPWRLVLAGLVVAALIGAAAAWMSRTAEPGTPAASEPAAD